MAKHCVRCGNKTGLIAKVNTSIGVMCIRCGSVATSPSTTTAEQFEELHSERERRLSLFEPTSIMKNLGSARIEIDLNNRMFREGQGWFVYYFSEVSGYESKKVGGQTITKNKGGLARAAVGGALLGGAGAVVGASTATQVTTTTGGNNVCTIEFESYRGKHSLDVFDPPFGLEGFLDQCLFEQDDDTDISDDQSDPTDEIRKYKGLLDDGIITQEDFDAKKKQLLGI